MFFNTQFDGKKIHLRIVNFLVFLPYKNALLSIISYTISCDRKIDNL